MQITVSGKQIDLSDILRDRVWERLNMVGERVQLLDAQVTFRQQRGLFICEITVRAARIQVRSEAGAEDAYHAFDRALQPIATRLVETRSRRYKRRGESADDSTFRTWMTDDNG